MPHCADDVRRLWTWGLIMAMGFDVVDRTGQEFTAVVEFEETDGSVDWKAMLWKDGVVVETITGICASKEIMAQVAFRVGEINFTARVS